MARKSLTIAALFGSDACLGAILPFARTAGAVHVIFVANVLIWTFFVFTWYRFDSEDRGFPRRWFLNAMIISMSAFAFPYYLFRTRGFARGILGSSLALGIFVGSAAVGITAAILSALIRGA